MTRELVPVPFHGDVLEAVQDDGGVWVSLRRMCESLGIAMPRQMRKLKEKPWANVAMKAMLDTAGRKFEVVCLHLDSVPMWLATIEASRVKKEIRPKLELYQREAARVLAEHFLPAPITKDSAPKTGMARVQMILEMAQQMYAQEARLCQQDSRLSQVENSLAVLTEERQTATRDLRALERAPEAAPPLSLRARVNQRVRAYCRARSADHREVWRKLYHEMYYRCQFNAQERARNAGKLALDVVEEEGLMPDLFAIASEVLVF